MKCADCTILGVARPDNKVYCKALDSSFRPDAACCLTMDDAIRLHKKHLEEMQLAKETAQLSQDACIGLTTLMIMGELK
jgi:hypothetical protein